ncbi:VOC family protein [Galbitalea sp. SE-J8]|uniref:VOC family protein n=1 Tax=Galbitalea sp. SE-J8 TaxID=3054952 RepID=UPI00259CAFA6|nr:VOC family protein [Galbitalea sp. SE-J8]MDM4761676.1 VOC family protein [Galbitalea sp. SE-J8]
MSPRIANITIHAEDPPELARFWAAVMGYPEPAGWPAELEAELRAAGMDDDDLTERAIAWDDDPQHPRFFFTRYQHERRQRNRMHIDLTPSSAGHADRAAVEAEADRLVALGASVEKVLTEPWGPYEEFAIMMRDPEGNEFCVQ